MSKLRQGSLMGLDTFRFVSLSSLCFKWHTIRVHLKALPRGGPFVYNFSSNLALVCGNAIDTMLKYVPNLSLTPNPVRIRCSLTYADWMHSYCSFMGIKKLEFHRIHRKSTTSEGISVIRHDLHKIPRHNDCHRLPLFYDYMPQLMYTNHGIHSTTIHSKPLVLIYKLAGYPEFYGAA